MPDGHAGQDPAHPVRLLMTAQFLRLDRRHRHLVLNGNQLSLHGGDRLLNTGSQLRLTGGHLRLDGGERLLETRGQLGLCGSELRLEGGHLGLCRLQFGDGGSEIAML